MFIRFSKMFPNIRLPKIKGTKKILTKNQLLISLGLPSLDILIGGGIPVGSLFLIEEDEFGVYSNMILKHYLAEGIVSDHALLLGSLDIDTRKLVLELPSPLHGDLSAASEEDKCNDRLRIAWRYQDQASSSNRVNSNIFGNTYDLGTVMKSCTFEKTDIKHWTTITSNCDNRDYNDLYDFIKSIVENHKYNMNTLVEDRTILRIALISLGTACWNGNISKFLIKLRFLLRNAFATCLITIPPHLFNESKTISRCEHSCDTVIELKSLANEGNAAYDDYDGLLIVKKLSMKNSWTPIVPESNDWGFKVKKKHFIVEKLHISPELKENQHREEDVANQYKTQKVFSTVSDQF